MRLPTGPRSRSGRRSATLRILCSWQRWITGWSKTSATALRSAFAPSMPTRMGRVTSIPPVAQAGEQVGDDSGVLGGALDQRQRVLDPLGVDAQRDHAAGLAE